MPQQQAGEERAGDVTEVEAQPLDAATRLPVDAALARLVSSVEASGHGRHRAEVCLEAGASTRRGAVLSLLGHLDITRHSDGREGVEQPVQPG